MKKHLILFLLLPFAAQTQVPDSLIIATRVDSLTAASKGHLEAYRLPEALQSATQAKQLTEQHFGKSHPGYIYGCFVEVSAHWRMGDYPTALNASGEAMALQKDAFGKENALYASLLHIRGTLHLEMANYLPGEQDFLECLAIREKVLGKNTAAYAMTLNNLGNLYNSTGDLDKAIASHAEAMQTRREVLGTEHVDYALSLINLGRIYGTSGEYEKSISYLKQAIQIYEKTENHIGIETSFFLLGLSYTLVGQYKLAETYLLSAMELIGTSVGKEHPKYANVLNDLGVLYGKLHLYKKAKDLFLQSIEINEKTIGREHIYTMGTLLNIANIHQEEGNPAAAMEIYQELNAIYQKNYAPDHPDYLTVLNNQANVYFDLGEWAKGDSLHRAVLETLQTKLGKDHPDCANSYTGIARAHRQKRQFPAAWEMLQQALRICETAYTPSNIQTINTHLKLAETAWEMGQPQRLFDHANTHDKLLKQHLIQSAKHLSANELQLQMPERLAGLDFSYSALKQFGQTQPANTGHAFDNALLFKGMLLENTISLENALTLAPDSLRQRYLEWKALQRRLSEIYSLPLSAQSGAQELEHRAEVLEKSLLRQSVFRISTEAAVNWQQVQSKLQPGEAAIEFVRFFWKNPNPTDSVLYAALVLLPDAAQPAFIPLFEEKQLDSLVQVKSVRRAEYVDNLYSVNDRGAMPLGKPQKSLYELLWQPLEKELATVKTVYFSSSGLLHRLNLGAIPTSGDEILADRYHLTELGSTRQLVVPTEAKIANNDASFFGGIQYEMDSTAISQANAALATEGLASRGSLNYVNADSSLRGGTWSYLKWTEKEVAALETLAKSSGFQVTVRKGHTATEEAFKAIGRPLQGDKKESPRILHIATHGFFFPDPKDRNMGRGMRDDEPVFKMSDHPMIRSGLILAGGNHAWQTGKPLQPDMEDGILTAYEISQMNLAATELVVLSACETGLGDIQGNEGVYGLQRAFKIAGAKYLIMSLWQVPDFQTQELMTTFYKNWLEGKMTIPDAFRSAQKEMREKYQNPYFWAGFVLVE